MPRSEVLPRPGQKFGSSFLPHAHCCSASGTTASGTRASPKPGNKGRPNGWRYVGRKEETRLKSNGRKERMKNTKKGKRREGRWTPIRAKAQDTRANPNSWETHLVRKQLDIGLLRTLSLCIMMMMMMMMSGGERVGRGSELFV